MPTPLPVLKIIPNAFIFLWNNKKRFLYSMRNPATILICVLFIPMVLSYLLSGLGPFNFPFFFGIIIFVVFGILILSPYVLFAITCHRLVLIGNEGVPKFGLRTWAQREWWFLAFVCLLPFVYILIGLFIGPLIGGLSMEFNIDGEIYQKILFGRITLNQILNYLILFTTTYIFSRLSLLLPATAVDRDVDVPWAWKISKNNGWRLTIIVGVLPWTLSLLSDFFLREDATIVETIVFMLISFIFLAVEIVALSLSYKHLTENEVIENNSS